MALQMGATFVGRSFSGDKEQLVPLIKAAMTHRGFALLDATGDAWERFTAGDVLVSEPLAYHLGLQPGASLELPTAAGAAASAAAGTPDALYRAAYEDYMRGNYDLAEQGFRDYMERWPSTELTDNALYWIGECLDAQDEPAEALEVFTMVLDDYPTSDKAAAAQLKKGLLYLNMDDQAQGVVHLQYVVYEHPGTPEADLARERLRSLGMTIR